MPKEKYECPLFSYPAGIGNEQGVVFDVTRQISFKDWTIDAGVVSEKRPWKSFPAIDESNDDASQSDEDNVPDNQHVYSIDGPGEPDDGSHAQVISRNNFYEFVRVRFDGNALAGNNNDGSRCSDKVAWHVFYWIERNGAAYQKRAGKTNEVETNGHLSLDPQPAP